MLCNLDHDLRVGRLARSLDTAVKLEDPYARTFALNQAGLVDVHPRDSFDAGRLEQVRRRAFATAEPVAPRGRLGAALDKAADVAAFALLLAAWVAVYCLVCPPAHAETAIVTDEQLAEALPFALFVALLLLTGLWVRFSRDDA